MPYEVDVLVVGGGPAGSATASQLALRGRSVLLVRGGRVASVGDHLPGGARPLLSDLGAWGPFLDTEPLPSEGVASTWGGEEPRIRSAVMDPFGGGWHVDRGRFDAMFRDHAERSGAQCQARAWVRELVRAGGGWSARCVGDGLESRVRARWVVDATGRRAWVGRRVGAPPRIVDLLHGFVRFWEHAEVAPHALVEARREGWWYSAALPGARGVTMFMTDAAPGAGRRWTSWWEGSRTAERFAACRGRGRVEAWRAASQWTTLTDPDGWLPVGDAALARDPLSSRGLVSALEGALECSAAVDAALAGDPTTATRYLASVAVATRAYLSERRRVYGREARYDTRFWRRRASLTPP